MKTLTEIQREFLHLVARHNLESAVTGTPLPKVDDLAKQTGITLDGPLVEHRGAFVTLTSPDGLRGCIGYIQGFKPLLQAVADNSRSAAIDDPRFNPVGKHELGGLKIEISVLSPLVEIPTHQDIQVGKHGILLEKNGRQAVFLPQVATEQGWNKDTTLSYLAQKAGLPPDGWKQGARFQVFEAEVF